MAVINYSPKQGVLGTRQQPSMTLAEIAARLSAQENALPTMAIGGVLGLVNQAREYDYPDTALGWASLPAKAVTGVAKGMMNIPGEMIDDANAQVAGLNDGRAVTEGALGLLTMSPLATAPAGATRIFAGRNAKTADLDAMARAEKMLADGADRGQVWNKTGWFKDVDGQMKFEIDDSGAAMRPDYANATTAKDAISHPEMFSAYPELGDVSFSAEPMKRNQGGVYHPRNHELSEPASMKINTNKTGDEATSISLHELGAHGVQDIEGFAKGGNLTSAYMDGALRKKWGEEIHKLLKPKTEAQFTKLLKASWPEATPQQLKNGYKSYAKDARKAQRDPYHPAAQAAQSTAAERLYLRQAGEAEARNVQTRMNYTPEQRRATPPWATLDVPEDELIVRRK